MALPGLSHPRSSPWLARNRAWTLQMSYDKPGQPQLSPLGSPRGRRWCGGRGGQPWRTVRRAHVGALHELCLPLPPPALRYLCRRAKYRCCAEAAIFLQIHDFCNTSQPPREEQSISRRVPGRREIQSWMPSSLVFLPLGAVGSVCECVWIPFSFGAVWRRTGAGRRGQAHRCAAWASSKVLALGFTRTCCSSGKHVELDPVSL